MRVGAGNRESSINLDAHKTRITNKRNVPFVDIVNRIKPQTASILCPSPSPSFSLSLLSNCSNIFYSFTPLISLSLSLSLSIEIAVSEEKKTLKIVIKRNIFP